MKDYSGAYNIIERLLEIEDWQSAAEASLSIAEQKPDESFCWYLRSKALQGLAQPSLAKHDILVALDLEPLNLDYFFQLCMVLIQANEATEIPLRINKLWPHVKESDRDRFIGFVEKGLKTQMLHRLELSNEILSAVIRYRNSLCD